MIQGGILRLAQGWPGNAFKDRKLQTKHGGAVILSGFLSLCISVMKEKSLLGQLEKFQIGTAHPSITRRQPSLLGGVYSMPEILTQNCSFDSKFRLLTPLPHVTVSRTPLGVPQKTTSSRTLLIHWRPLDSIQSLVGGVHTLLARCNYWTADVSCSPEEMTPWLISKCPQLEKLYQCDSSSIWQQAWQANPLKKVLGMF